MGPTVISPITKASMVIMNKASESIRKIQEAARQRVSERVSKDAKTKKAVLTVLANHFDDLKQEIVTQLSATAEMPSLPPMNCRCIVECNNGRRSKRVTYCESHGVMILEFPPTTRIINAVDRADGKFDIGKFNIPFPYFYFVIYFSKIIDSNDKIYFLINQRGVGARISPLKFLNDKIGCIPIPHTNGLNYICQSEANTTSRYSSLQDLATDVANTFWSTQFVHDFTPFVVDKKRICSWSQWEKLTSLDMLKVNLQTQTTVQSLVDKVLQHRSNPLRNTIQNLISQTEIKLQTEIQELAVYKP